jgi:hypothetical protein
MKQQIPTTTQAPAQPGSLDDYLSPEEQAEELDTSTRTLARWRAMRCGPPYTRVGRKLKYRRRWTAAWIERHAVDPEAEASNRRRRS